MNFSSVYLHLLILSNVCLQEEIYSSSYAVAAYLESINFPKDKKVNLSCIDFLA